MSGGPLVMVPHEVEVVRRIFRPAPAGRVGADIAGVGCQNDETPRSAGLLEVPLRGFEPRFPP